MIIKKWNGTAWENLYPDVNITSIKDVSNGNISIFDNGKLRPNYLPQGILDNLSIAGSLTSTYPTEDSINGLIQDALELARDQRGNIDKIVGYYWISTVIKEILLAGNLNFESTGVYYQGQMGIGETDGSNPRRLEANDWIFISKFVKQSGTNASPHLVTFDVVNNTYELATSNSAGIVKLTNNQSSLQDLQGVANVVTGGHIYNLINNTYALTSHKHNGADITTGTVAVARLGTGTPTAYNWLRGDGVWTALPTATQSNSGVVTLTNNQYSLQDMQGETNVVTGGHLYTLLNGTYALGSHKHGHITSDGKLQATDVNPNTSDRLVITDASDGEKIVRSSLLIDKNATDNKFLSENGIWSEPTIPYAGSDGGSHGIVEYLGTQTAALDTTWASLTNNTKAIHGGALKVLVEKYIAVSAVAPTYKSTGTLWLDIS